MVKKEKSFKEYLVEIEDPKNNREVNYALPENPTPLQIAKYELCKRILLYQINNKLTDEEMTKKMSLSKLETENVLFCRIEEFTLNQLVNCVNKLLSFSEEIIPNNFSQSIQPLKTENIFEFISWIFKREKESYHLCLSVSILK